MENLASRVLRELEGFNSVFVQTMHHYISLDNFDGWHLRAAKAIKRYTGIPSVLINPGRVSRPELYYIDGFPIILVPYMDFTRIKLYRLGHLSPSWVKLVRTLASSLVKEGHNVYLFIHAPRALNSILLFQWLKNLGATIIAQNHGERNYYYALLRSVRDGVYNPAKLLYYQIMHQVDCSMAKASEIVYSLTSYDVHYYRKICGARSRISTMGVFFEELKPKKSRCCGKVKRIIFVGGSSRLSKGDWKGSDILVRVYKALGGRKSGYELVMVCKINDPTIYRIGKDLGIVFTGRLSYQKVLDLISDSDAYIITARRSYYWGGVGVALMEAMAMNVPVISPTLVHVPPPDRRS